MPPSLLFHLHDDGGVRQPEQLGQNHAGLPVAQVVGLQAGEDKIRRFGLDGGGQQTRAPKRIEGAHVFFDVDGAVGAFGQGFTNGLRGALGPGAERNHFAAVFFLQLQRRFQGISVGLVDFVARSASSIHLPDAAMRNCESRAGTCLIATMIFMLKETCAGRSEA